MLLQINSYYIHSKSVAGQSIIYVYSHQIIFDFSNFWSQAYLAGTLYYVRFHYLIIIFMNSCRAQGIRIFISFSEKANPDLNTGTCNDKLQNYFFTENLHWYFVFRYKNHDSYDYWIDSTVKCWQLIVASNKMSGWCKYT